jgi:hypothetical protein
MFGAAVFAPLGGASRWLVNTLGWPVDVVIGEPFDFVFHTWYSGIVMESFITYVPRCVEGYA